MKKGFTLAEVLVTLGIVGVIAALTTPALIQNVNGQRIGPKLAKAVSTFETASEMYLTEENLGSLMSQCGTNALIGGGTCLGRFMKISSVGAGPAVADSNVYRSYDGASTIALNTYRQYNSDDGVTYYVSPLARANASITFANIPSNIRIGSIYIDVNGRNQGPNRLARDTFRFHLYNDGTLRPYGGVQADRRNAASPTFWSDHCNNTVTDNGETCAGSIFENNLRVTYE